MAYQKKQPSFAFSAVTGGRFIEWRVFSLVKKHKLQTGPLFTSIFQPWQDFQPSWVRAS
jgi:hypothetical protein